MDKNSVSTFRHVWAAPTAIGVAVLAGLVIALLGDGIEDWLGWAALALPLAIIAWAWAKARRSQLARLRPRRPRRFRASPP